jgi:hypothetical protein
VVTVTTQATHNLQSGLLVEIQGHSVGALNGAFTVNVTGSSTFTLLHPVTNTPIASTAAGAGGVARAKLTAWEGAYFKPLAGVAYQRAYLLPATPENPSYGNSLIRETGMFQIMLNYPTGLGTLAVTTRAELIRSTFKRGAVFSADGVDVKILKTPAIIGGHPVDEYFVVPVVIEYQADIFNS